MIKLFNEFSAFLILSLPLVGVLAEHYLPPQARHHGRHQELAMRAEGRVQLHKRFSNSKWSFYNTETGNAGACGRHITNNQFAVAMNVPQYDGKNCFQTITLQWHGITRQAVIMDMCPGCPHGGLDLSPALFQQFASQDVGIIWDGNWWFGGEPATTSSRKSSPTPIPTPTPTPTPTRRSSTTTHSPSSSYAPPSSSVSPSSSSSSAVVASSSGFSSGAGPRPTGDPVPSSTATGNLDLLSQVILEFAQVAIVGGATQDA